MEQQNYFCADLVLLEHDKPTRSRLAAYTSFLRMPMNITAMKLLQFADAILLFETWCQKCLKKSPQFHFWPTSLRAETRSKCDQGDRRRVTDEGRHPPVWHTNEFL